MIKTIVPLLCIAVILSLCGAMLFYMQTSPRFEINRIGIRGHARILPETIVEALQIEPRTNIFQIQLDAVKQKLEAMQWIKSAEVYRNFPDKLSIRLVERVPFALVKVDKLYLVDVDGVVLGALASGSAIRLPIITGSFVKQILLNGDNPELAQAFHTLNTLLNSSHPLFHHIRKIQIESPENVILFSDDSLPQIWLSLLSIQQGMERLERIYPELTVEQIASIDLRFQKRIIVTPNKS
ncbi:cell division protein FtsQ [Candidatus Vecturithrix granuli]|uniref:Cell division protein FtsQ n=1 Tax=Vecturithrix granuli TaxID=1499967 RepID=A0A081BYD2_VECG1|nr:cell division protein FtsQ [Candidatus Vecturithrix granuli]